MSESTLRPEALEALEQRIAPLRAQLAVHPLYKAIRTVDQVRVFMESHVFAVWDFMCLLKGLQRALTSVDTLWIPTSYPASRRFINEIVLGEESDEYDGRPLSHFEIYLESMENVGADTSVISGVIGAIREDRHTDSISMDESLRKAPQAAEAFVRETLRGVREGSLPAQAAAFTFGREDAIPDMFRSLVRDINIQQTGKLSQFIWYLERHIEVDGNDHGPLSLRMVADVCGDDPSRWQDATHAAESALRARLALWDGILDQVRSA